MATRLQIRRDTVEGWRSANPILLEGEIGFILSDGKVNGKKIGNGTTRWRDLPVIKDITEDEYDSLMSMEGDVRDARNSIEALNSDVSNLQSYVLNTPEEKLSLSDFTLGYYLISNNVGVPPQEPIALAGYGYRYYDVREGEEWRMRLNGGANARAWALLDASGVIIEYAANTGIREYSVTIPACARRMLVQSGGMDGNITSFYVIKEAHTATIERLFTYNENVEIGWDVGVARKTVVGQSTEKVAYTGYRSIYLDNLVKGDRISYSVIGGATYNGIALTKQGVVISSSVTLAASSGEIECDGSFDGIVLNYYELSDLAASNPYHASRLVRKTVQDLGDELKDFLRAGEQSKKTLRVLCFGNSFTQDSMGYVPHILRTIAPSVELTLGLAYIGGCSLAQHLSSFTGTSQTVDGEEYSPTDYAYYKSVGGGSWNLEGYKNPDAMINDEKWDVITFQQNGTTAAKDFEKYYTPFIHKLLRSLFGKLTYNVKIGWLLTQGAYSSTNEGLYAQWEGTAANSKKVLETTGVSVLFPFGTAVENLRTTSARSLGDGGNLMADSGHLQDGLGCLTAAYANTLVMLDLVGLKNGGVIGDGTRIDAELINQLRVPGTNMGTSGVVGINDQNCYLAQVAAECAVKSPYEVTNISSSEV